ncbi:MAG: malate dehydrogenase [Nitrososphaerota archaeon]|jgi:malate dehydrogenase|nr:malate dehydrogenase [Nitrososphaerota archaeon]MDG6923954.1 malate dehydrogenase [Nitrososphaerota archaeon]
MISIIGSGRVGSTLAMVLMQRNIDDITLVDVIPKLPEGEALDLSHMAAELGIDVKIKGSNDYSAIRGSDMVVVTAGLARKPDMTRMDLLLKNTGIAKAVSAEVAKYAPNSNLLWVANPLDVLVYVALKTTGFKKNRVFGMGGMLDLSRFKEFLSANLNISRSSISALVIGEHGEAMTPIPSYTSVNGIPIRNFLSEQQLDDAVEKTRKIAAEVIAKKGATFYAPASGIARMVEAVHYDKKALLPVCTYLEGEYGASGLCIGVPAILGKDGVEKIIELKLSDKERQSFDKGVANVKEAIASIQV